MLALGDDLLFQIFNVALREEEVWCERMHVTNRLFLSLVGCCRRFRAVCLGRSAACGTLSFSLAGISVARVVAFLERMQFGSSVILWGSVCAGDRDLFARIAGLRVGVESRERWSYRPFYSATTLARPRVSESVSCRGRFVIVRRPVRVHTRLVTVVSEDDYKNFALTSQRDNVSLTVSQMLVGRSRLSVALTVPESTRLIAFGLLPCNGELSATRHLHVVPVSQRNLGRRYASGRLVSVSGVVVSHDQLCVVVAFALRECANLSWINLDPSLCDERTCLDLVRRICPTVGTMARVLYGNTGVVSCGYANRVEYMGRSQRGVGGVVQCYLRICMMVDPVDSGFMFVSPFLERLLSLLCGKHTVSGDAVEFVVRDMSLMFDVSSGPSVVAGALVEQDVAVLARLGRCRCLFQAAASTVCELGLFQFGGVPGSELPRGLGDVVMRVVKDVACPRLTCVRADMMALYASVWYLRFSPVVSLRVSGDAGLSVFCGSMGQSVGAGAAARLPQFTGAVVCAVAKWWAGVTELSLYEPDVDWAVPWWGTLAVHVFRLVKLLPALVLLRVSVGVEPSLRPEFVSGAWLRFAGGGKVGRRVCVVIHYRPGGREDRFELE
jgi:hypothetical protein